MEHARVLRPAALLQPGDTLVFNDSKVLPARVLGQKPTGGAVELLFLRPLAPGGDNSSEGWEALVRPSRRLRVGTEVMVGGAERLRLDEELGEGRWLVRAARRRLADRDHGSVWAVAAPAVHPELSGGAFGLSDGLRRGSGVGGGAHCRTALHPRAACSA